MTTSLIPQPAFLLHIRPFLHYSRGNFGLAIVNIEKRFQQTKTVHEIAPVLLKNPGRIEALFTLYFLALLVQALIEREPRTAMRRARVAELPLYPEERRCKRPTTEQVLRLLSHAERHVLLHHGQPVQVFPPELTDLQQRVLALLGVPVRAFGA
jgi:hypothetical protein